VAILTIWIVWLIDILVMVVIMLNFLVAEVGQTYENVMSAGMTLIYRTRADMNVKALLYSEILSKEQSDSEF